MSLQTAMFLAKALYDNMAETPEELAFRRGDVLTVLEQDTNGLDGWWLCTLRGKQGIAPGNRLKIISGMTGPNTSLNLDKSHLSQIEHGLYSTPPKTTEDYDVPPANRGNLLSPSKRRSSNDSRASSSRGASMEDLYDTPPSSKRGSAEAGFATYDTPPSSKRESKETPPTSNRSSASRDSGSNLCAGLSPSQLSLNSQHSSSSLNLPSDLQKRIQRDMYCETPPSSNRSSLDRILCEEGPPIYESLSPAMSSEKLSKEDDTYDIPRARTHMTSQASNNSESSLQSISSIGSSSTNSTSASRLSRTANLDSVSNSDLTQDYDVPPPSKSDRSQKQLSVDSGLGFYDSPLKSRPSSSNSSNSLSMHSEGMKSSQSTADSKPDMKRTKSLEHALDDFYDVPKNNSQKVNLKKVIGSQFGSLSAISDSSGVYDIPPQVTRDSVISVKSDSSDDRLSLSSVDLENVSDFPQWDEIFLDLDSALETLVKRQQDVKKATSQLLRHIAPNWRSKTSLEKSLYDIKVSCSSIRRTLHEFVDFVQGSVTNAVKVPDLTVANRIYKHLSPLENYLDSIKQSYSRLENIKWQVTVLVETENTESDDLGRLVNIAENLMPGVKKAASCIYNSSSVLFKKANKMSCKPPIGPNTGNGKPKMTHRPLPAVPGEKPTDSSIFDLESVLKDDYAECDDLPDRKQKIQLPPDHDYVCLGDSESRSSTLKSQKGDPLSNLNTFHVKNASGSENSLNDLVSLKSALNEISGLQASIENKSWNSNLPEKQNKINSDVDMVPVKEVLQDLADPEDLKTPVNKSSVSDSMFNSDEQLDPNDRQVLVYHIEKINSHSTLLGNAIDAFVTVVGSNQPPNVFISHSKFVIVSAHKLVHIGDSIHRNLISNNVSARVMRSANHLCDCLKASVTATKTAALQYPSPPAVQEMVDKVVAVSHAAHELKLVINQATQQ